MADADKPKPKPAPKAKPETKPKPEPVVQTAPKGEPEPDFTSGPPKVEGLKAGLELSKQIITLCVGMIALTITFLKDIVAPTATGARDVPQLMIWAWSAYVIALLGALGTLMGITGALTTLDRFSMKLPVPDDHRGAYDVYAWTVRAPMLLMCVAFLLAIVLTVTAASVGAATAAGVVSCFVALPLGMAAGLRGFLPLAAIGWAMLSGRLVLAGLSLTGAAALTAAGILTALAVIEVVVAVSPKASERLKAIKGRPPWTDAVPPLGRIAGGILAGAAVGMSAPGGGGWMIALGIGLGLVGALVGTRMRVGRGLIESVLALALAASLVLRVL